MAIKHSVGQHTRKMLATHHSACTASRALFQLLQWNTEFVVQTHLPLGIHICTRSQEDADGLGMASHRKQR